MSARTWRRLLWPAALLVAVVAVSASGFALFSGLAIAEQPGRPLDLSPVTVTIPTDVPSGPDTPATTPSPSATPSPSSTEPELIPAPAPVVVDDHGGDNPDHDDDLDDDSSGSSGKGSDDN